MEVRWLAAACVLSGLAVGVLATLTASRHPAGDGSDVLRLTAPRTFVLHGFGPDGKPYDSASAIEIRPGLVATNRHVVMGARSLVLEQGGRHWSAAVQRCDERGDLCLLTAPSLPAVPPLQLSLQPTPGQPAYAIGAPEGIELVISQGLVSGIRRVEGVDQLVTSAPVSPGSSGGGIFDSQARLLGITRAAVSDGEDLSLAVPAAVLSKMLAAPVTRRRPRISTAVILVRPQ